MAVVVEADAPASEETVVVPTEDAPLADGAMVGARRGVVLAVVTVCVSWLGYHWESHAAAGGIGREEEPVAGESVEQEDAHEADGDGVGWFAGKDDGCYVEDSVEVS